jgi:tRNA nucleotidyltransferase (CCA-adding enzyme)
VFGSSLEMSERVLVALGLPPEVAAAHTRRFREHDEDLLRRQYLVYDDEAALVQTAQDSRQDLMRLFEADVTESSGPPGPSNPPARTGMTGHACRTAPGVLLVGGAVRDRLLGLTPATATGWWSAPRRRPCSRPVSSRWGATFRCSCTRTPARSTHWPAPSASPGAATAASSSMPRPRSRWKTTRCAAISPQCHCPGGGWHLVDPCGGVADLQARVLRHVGRPSSKTRCECCARHLHGPLCATGLPHRTGNAGADAEDGRQRRARRAGARARLAGAAQGTGFGAAIGLPATLHETGALAVVLPEVEALYGVPQRAEYHPEIDTGRHVEMVCDMAARIAPGDAGVGFAALTHDLGKALTPRDEWPRHVMHEQRGVAPLKALCERLKLPVEIRDLAVIACREHLNVHRIAELRDATVLELLERCDGFRKPGRIAALAQVCQADARGRLGFGDSAYPQGTQLCRLHAAALAVNARGLAQQGLSGPQIGQALAKARIAAISAARGPR